MESTVDTRQARGNGGTQKAKAEDPSKVVKSRFITGDSLTFLSTLRDNSVDLVLCSPPYGNQRRYGSKKALFANDKDWLHWTADRYMECIRVCRGLVAFVVEGYTQGGTFHPLPEMLTMEIVKRGANLRRRCIFKRIGIMGGSPDEFAQHHEIIVCASKRSGRLPYSKPNELGHAPKCPPGGAPSHQSRDGRVNRPKLHSARGGSEDKELRHYKPPEKVKVSNVVDCGVVGGGNMGSKFAHENEAPYPERLAEMFIASYCPSGGLVVDPFSGSGTTVCVAARLGRNGIGIEIRPEQNRIAQQRLMEVFGDN